MSISRSREKLEEVAAEVREAGGSALVVPADVSSPREVTGAVGSIVEKLGRIDVLFNNAGRSHVGRTDEVPP